MLAIGILLGVLIVLALVVIFFNSWQDDYDWDECSPSEYDEY